MEFFAAATAPFAVALLVTLGIGVVEIAGLLGGLSASAAIDNALPDLDADIDAGAPEAIEPGPLSAMLSWLNFGRLPALVVLILLAGSFGVSGFLVQWGMQSAFGFTLAPALASVPALVAALWFTRLGGRGLSRIMPREETDAVSSAEFVGRIATVLRGEARAGAPAEAKLKDMRGKTHYLLVEPDEPAQAFGAGAEVLIVSRRGPVYRAVTRLRRGAGTSDGTGTGGSAPESGRKA